MSFCDYLSVCLYTTFWMAQADWFLLYWEPMSSTWSVFALAVCSRAFRNPPASPNQPV